MRCREAKKRPSSLINGMYAILEVTEYDGEQRQWHRDQRIGELSKREGEECRVFL